MKGPMIVTSHIKDQLNLNFKFLVSLSVHLVIHYQAKR